MRTLAVAAILCAPALPVGAQPRPASPTPAPSASSEAPEETLAAEDADAPPADTPIASDGDLAEPGVLAAIPWSSAFTGHIHNKVVHFPLALGMAAAVFLIIAPRWPAYAPAARPLLIAAALASVVAYFSGGAQEDQFDDSPFHAVVELHEKFGIATALTFWAGVALTFWLRARRFLPVYAIVLLLLLGCTGFLGGVLSHS